MNALATEKQVSFIEKLIAERANADLNEKDLTLFVSIELAYGAQKSALDKQIASRMIDGLLSISTKAAAKKAIVQDDAPANPSIKLGTYTVVMNGDENDYVTLKVDNATWADVPGKVSVSYLCGSDNEASYKAFAFVGANGINVWQRFRQESRIVEAAKILWAIAQTEAGLGEAHEKFLQQAEAYALASGRCMRCHRTLTVPASLHRGLGPECANKEGI